MTIQRISRLTLVLLALFLLNWSKILDFNSWQQIEDLHSSNSDLFSLSDHPHFYRYLISSPGLFARDYLLEFGFSLYISFFMLCSIVIVYYKLQGKNKFIVIFSCIAIFFGHLFMNGRGAISWLGWMIILSIISEDTIKIGLSKIFLIVFALLCCSVSSGTFTVAFFVTLTVFMKQFFYKKSWNYAVCLSLIYFLYKDLALEGIERNLSYYSLGTGNPIINMLEHGIGKVVRENATQFSIFISIVFAILTFIIFSLRSRLKLWEVVCLIYPLAGGVFGYTTLTLIMPSLILVLSSRIGASAQGRTSKHGSPARIRTSQRLNVALNR